MNHRFDPSQLVFENGRILRSYRIGERVVYVASSDGETWEPVHPLEEFNRQMESQKPKRKWWRFWE